VIYKPTVAATANFPDFINPKMIKVKLKIVRISDVKI
jgi:hypothetical protein